MRIAPQQPGGGFEGGVGRIIKKTGREAKEALPSFEKRRRVESP